MVDINLSNILHDKRRCKKVQQYFQNRSPPVISYKYSSVVAAKILNFNANMRSIDIDDLLKAHHNVTVPHPHSDTHVMAMSSQHILVSFQSKT